MTHNIAVSIQAAALGLTCGLGTVIVLFYNGVILSGVCLDYIDAGQGEFLAGWLLPHGSVEIPAILLAGQIGLALGGALIGWGERTALRERMREVSGDLVTLLIGLSGLLVWAGIVEAFFSQYHQPLVPYWTKIGFGAVQLAAGVLWIALAGRRPDPEPSAEEDE
ncbi:MAG: stage II sporulation protein M [Phycisphaerae bacterium]